MELKIINAPSSFAMFLVAMNIPFRFSYGEFIIENTHDEEKFRNYCLRNGVRESDLNEMIFSVVEIF